MASAIYNLLFKRTSTVVVVILASSFVFERSVNVFSDKMFESINKGKLWKDIKDNYGA
ncbi:ubiquinol-cytochrome C reductase complex subunit oxen [Osmia lignaria lignaria]|uniref:ubiquinol-cytochrome C reductase complex subunit oxen n=1 Tax=Osmia lignaria lignaria TaxID=1437193 RepID=UPI00147835ED|nr:cytochrome b-c1 complex subunit 9 [Osmia lignaria]